MVRRLTIPALIVPVTRTGFELGASSVIECWYSVRNRPSALCLIRLSVGLCTV